MNTWYKPLSYFIGKIQTSPRVAYKFKFSRDEPEHVLNKIIYVVGERPHHWMACFKCPCGCGEIISLNLLKQARPSWKFFIRWGKITFYPSIWRQVGCKSHFYIRRGKVKWSDIR